MKRTIRPNIVPAYTLHDMQVSDFQLSGDDLKMVMQTGLIKNTPPESQPDGWVEFHKVQWDYSYVYLMAGEGLAGNVGKFRGEKMFLKEFLRRFPEPSYTILDETYGYNQTKYSGFLYVGEALQECILEICHDGDMVFTTEE